MNENPDSVFGGERWMFLDRTIEYAEHPKMFPIRGHIACGLRHIPFTVLYRKILPILYLKLRPNASVGKVCDPARRVGMLIQLRADVLLCAKELPDFCLKVPLGND